MLFLAAGTLSGCVDIKHSLSGGVAALTPGYMLGSLRDIRSSANVEPSLSLSGSVASLNHRLLAWLLARCKSLPNVEHSLSDSVVVLDHRLLARMQNRSPSLCRRASIAVR